MNKQTITKLLLSVLVPGLMLFAKPASANVPDSCRVLLKFNLKGLPQGTILYYYPRNSNRLDSARVNGEVCSIALTLRQGDGHFYTFSLEKDNMGDPRKMLNIYLYAPAEIQITGEGGDFSQLRFSGKGDYLRDYVDFYRTAMKASREMPSTEGLLDDLRSEDTVVVKKSMAELSAMAQRNADLKNRWILAHRGSALSTALLAETLASNINLSTDSLSWYYNKLSPNAVNNPDGRTIKAAISSRREEDARVKLNKVETAGVVEIGKPAPDFTQTDTAGNPVSLHEFKGKYVLLNFWGTWCHWCRKEHPELVAGFQKYKDSNFTVISIASDLSKEAWIKAIHTDNLGGWTNLSDLSRLGNSVATLYGVSSWPTSILIDPEGKMLYRGSGQEALQQIFKMLAISLKK